jgi:prepilin peptidase CpaA
MYAQVLSFVPPLAMVGYATVTDVRSRRIPNWLTLALVVTGLAQAMAWDATGIGLAGSAKGLVAGFAVPFAFFAIRALGAGDVKLLAGIGAWVGAGPVLWIMLIAAALGGVVAIVQGLAQRRLALLFGNTFLLAANIMQMRKLGTAKIESMGTESPTLKNTIPYAVPIFFATVGYVIAHVTGKV